MSGKDRIAQAEQGSARALDAWRAACAALGTDLSVNGCGVLRDPQALRQRFLEAQHNITKGLVLIDSIDWPSDQDYDTV